MPAQVRCVLKATLWTNLEKTHYSHVLARIQTEHTVLRRGAWRRSSDFRGDVQRTGVETHADVPPGSRRQKYLRF